MVKQYRDWAKAEASTGFMRPLTKQQVKSTQTQHDYVISEVKRLHLLPPSGTIDLRTLSQDWKEHVETCRRATAKASSRPLSAPLPKLSQGQFVWKRAIYYRQVRDLIGLGSDGNNFSKLPEGVYGGIDHYGPSTKYTPEESHEHLSQTVNMPDPPKGQGSALIDPRFANPSVRPACISLPKPCLSTNFMSVRGTFTQGKDCKLPTFIVIPRTATSSESGITFLPAISTGKRFRSRNALRAPTPLRATTFRRLVARLEPRDSAP
jgi:hypothetical protein